MKYKRPAVSAQWIVRNCKLGAGLWPLVTALITNYYA